MKKTMLLVCIALSMTVCAQTLADKISTGFVHLKIFCAEKHPQSPLDSFIHSFRGIHIDTLDVSGVPGDHILYVVLVDDTLPNNAIASVDPVTKQIVLYRPIIQTKSALLNGVELYGALYMCYNVLKGIHTKNDALFAEVYGLQTAFMNQYQLLHGLTPEESRVKRIIANKADLYNPNRSQAKN